MSWTAESKSLANKFSVYMGTFSRLLKTIPGDDDMKLIERRPRVCKSEKFKVVK